MAICQLGCLLCVHYYGHPILKWITGTWHIDGLVQERRNSIANARESRLSRTNPSIWNQARSTNNGRQNDVPVSYTFPHGADLSGLVQYGKPDIYGDFSFRDTGVVVVNDLTSVPRTPPQTRIIVWLSYGPVLKRYIKWNSCSLVQWYKQRILDSANFTFCEF